jgi:hypothetical protein
MTKDSFKKQLTTNLPGTLCKKMAMCYATKSSVCVSKMQGPVSKCVNSGDVYYGKQITPESSAALDFLVRTCALRTFATENISKLVKKNKKCQQFSAAALTY